MSSYKKKNVTEKRNRLTDRQTKPSESISAGSCTNNYAIKHQTLFQMSLNRLYCGVLQTTDYMNTIRSRECVQ